jgi:hypothetical protein
VFLLQKEIVCEFNALHGKYQICRNLSYGFFLLHTRKVSHVCTGIKEVLQNKRFHCRYTGNLINTLGKHLMRICYSVEGTTAGV